MKTYMGFIKTDVVGSECQFDLDEDFASLSEDEREKALLSAMWGSGMLELYYEEVEDN